MSVESANVSSRRSTDDVPARLQRERQGRPAVAGRRPVLPAGDHAGRRFAHRTPPWRGTVAPSSPGGNRGDPQMSMSRTNWLAKQSAAVPVRRAGYAGAMIDEDEITEALSNVIDPELGLDFVELGLIYGVEVDGGNVEVTFTLTTPACPIGPQVSEQIVEFVVGGRGRPAGHPDHGLHPAVDPGQDVRGREVRARLLSGADRCDRPARHDRAGRDHGAQVRARR